MAQKKLTVKDLEKRRKAINKDEEDEKKAKAKAVKTAAPVYTNKEAGSKNSPPLPKVSAQAPAAVNPIGPPLKTNANSRYGVEEYGSAYNTYLNQIKGLMPYNSAMAIANHLKNNEMIDMSKLGFNNWNDDTASAALLGRNEMLDYFRQGGYFDRPEFLNRNYITEPSTSYLAGQEAALKAQLEDSKKKDEEAKAANSYRVNSWQHWSDMQNRLGEMTETNAPYFYAYADYLSKGDFSKPFDMDTYDAAWNEMDDDAYWADMDAKKKAFEGLDWGTLTDKNPERTAYQSKTGEYQSKYDMVSGELTRRKDVEAFETEIRKSPSYGKPYVAPAEDKGRVIMPGLGGEIIMTEIDTNTYSLPYLINEWRNLDLGPQLENGNPVVKKFFDNGMHLMSKDQLDAYNAAVEDGGEEYGQQYLDLILPDLRYQKYQYDSQYLGAMATNDIVGPLMSAATVPMNIMGSGLTAVGAALGIDDPYAPIYGMSHTVNTFRGKRGDVWGERLPLNILGEKAGRLLYNIGMSTADMVAAQKFASAVGTMTGNVDAAKNIMGAVMSTEVGTSTFLSDLQSGRGYEYAVLHGFTDGFISRVAESGFLDNLFSSDGNLIMKTLKSAGSEALEEMFEEGGQIVSDAFFAYLTGQENQIQETYNYYVATLGKDKAAMATLRDFGNRFAVAGLSGAAMGGGTATVYNTTEYIGNRSTGKALTKDGDPDRMLGIAKSMPEGSEARRIAEDIEGKVSGGKEMSLGDLGRMTNALAGELREEYGSTVKQVMNDAIAKRLVELGTPQENAQRNADAIRKMASGEKLTAEDRARAAWDVNADQVTRELTREMNDGKHPVEGRSPADPEGTRTGQGWVTKARLDQIMKTEEVEGKMRQAQAAANTKNVSTTVKEAVKRGADKVEAGKNGQPAAKETDRNITYVDGGVTGSGRLARFEEVDGKLTMAVVTGKGKDGKDTTVNVPLDSLNKASGKGTAGLIEAVKDINENLHPVSAEEASTMLATYELTGGDVGAFVENYERAYLSGYSGANNVSVAIDPKLAQMARESGQRQAEKDEQQRLQRAGDYKALETTVAGWLGKVSDNSQVHGMGDAEALAGALERMTETQRRTAEICLNLGKALGLNVVLFESDVKNLRGIQNGSFDEASHTVYLDINSGVGSVADLEAQRNSGTLGAAMLRVMSHELTHYLEVASPEMYAKYKAAVRAGLKAAGKETDMAVLIREKIDRALNAGRKMSYKAAEAEVIADASEYMLKDSKFTNDLDPTLKGKIKSFIQNFAQKVKEIFNHLTGSHKESAALREMKNGVLRYMDGLQELWDAGFDEILAKGTEEQNGDATEMVDSIPVEELETTRKFSMGRDVELREDGLIAMHNLKESDVRGTLALGGFPMPSIAIVKAKDGHTMYGDYSVLFGKETIDPANKKNRVYGADAWTPVFPHVETQIHDDILYDVQEGFRNLAAQVDEEYGKKARIWFGNFSGSDVTSKSLDDIAESAANNTGVMAAYLADHGETVEVVETDAPVDQGYKPERADQYEKILDIIDMNDYFNMPMHELLDTYGDRLAEVSGQLSRLNAHWKTGVRRSGEVMARVLKEAIAYEGSGRDKTVKTKRVKDYYATDDAIRARVDRKDVEAWAKEKLAPAFGEQGIYNGKDRFTPSGNRRSFKQTHNALTADNVVKSMLTQEESAIPVTDAKGLMAAAASMYKSIAEIKGDANRLGKISEEEYNARIAAADNAFRDFLNAIEAWDYDQIQDVGKLLVQAAKGRMDAKAISALLKRNGFPKATIKASIMAENVIQQVQTIPTGYFEAKPARVVGFDEIRMIVAPDTMPESLAALLDERGIPYTTYDGSDADRLEKVNAVEGVRFSDRDDYLLDGSEYGRFRRNWESRKTNHFTKRTNGGVLIDMGNLLVYTDRKGNPQHVLEVMTEDLWDENDIVQRAILLETGGYDKDEQQEILGRIFPEGSFRFRVPGDRSSNRGQNGRGSKRDVGKVRREDREEQSYEGAPPEVQVKRYSDRDLPDSITVREYLSGLKPTSRMTETEKILLKRYQEMLAQLEEKEKQVSEQEEIIRTAPFRNPDGSLNDEINKAKNRYKIYRDQANRISRELLSYERDEGFAGILATGRQVVQELTMGSAGGIADAADALETEVAELTARLTRLEAEVTRTAAGQRNAYARGLYEPKALNDAAKQLKDTYGSRMSVKSIADRLALTFGELYASEGTEGARLFSAAAKDLAVDLLQGNRFRYKSEILPMLKEKIGTISLTETDVQEIENRGYTLREYRSMLSPYIKVTTGGSDLSSVASNANYFGDGELAAVLEDETEGNLAMRLYEVISREKAREAEIAYEGMTESQLIGMAMADIAGANLPMSANNQTVEYLRKELLKYAGENADVAIAVEEAIGKAKATTSRASNVWREAVKHTETARQAVEYYRKLEEQRRVMELSEQKQSLTEQLKSDNAQKLKEKVEAQRAEYREREQKAREYRKSRVELDKVRKRISRNVKTINALRVRETDKKHVPQQLQLAADLLMQTFTDTNLGRLAFPQEKLDSLSRTYRLLLNEEVDSTHYWDDEIEADIENLRALSEAYTGLKNRKDGAPSVFTLEGVEYETEILRGVDNVVANILNMIDAWNDNFLRNRTETFEAFANKTGEQLRQHDDYKVRKGWLGKMQTMLDEGIRTGNMTPIYFFDHMKNPELLAVFDEIREGMHKAAMIEREGKEYIERVRTNRNYGKWVADGRLKMKTGNGHTIELTREEACEIYAIAKREKANKLYQTEHLLYGGFQYKHIDQHVSEDGKHLVQDMPHQLDAADMEKIGNWLTDEQKGYADDLVAFLSTRMAEYGNDASMAMYGYEKFTESYYIPFRTVAEQRYLRGDEGPQGENAGTGRLMNSSFTHKVQYKANATLYVGGISETVGEHIHKMAAYSAMVQPIENLKRLLNHKVLDNDGTANTLRALIGQKYGRAAENYMTQLLKDLNGATQSDQRASAWTDMMVSAFKRGAVMASASVVLQQPTAMARAMAMISPKYFAQNPFYRPSKGTWEKMMKYSGTAIIKDMGKYDVGMGKTASQYILDEDLSVAETYQRLVGESKTKAGKAALDRFIDWLTSAPGKADQWTWGLIWKAAEAETAALNPRMDRNSDEFMRLVGKRFDDVVDHTQVYDSVLTKSNLMRSQNGFHKMATSFMAEPTLSINMLYDALTGKHGKKQAARIIGSVAASQVLAGALAALVQAWNDDEDERNWMEKYADRASSNIFSNINVFGMIPYVSDIVSLFEGYDVERPDLSVIADVMDYTKKYFKGFEDGGIPSWKDTENFVGTLANLVGIPAKNISREIRRTRNAIFNTDWSAPSAFNLGQVISENTIFNSGKNTEYYQRIVTAELRGDTKLADNLRSYMLTSKMVTEDKMKSDIKTALKEAYIAGDTDDDTAIDMLVKIGAYDDREDAYWEVDKWQYMQETGESADSYGKYSDFFSAVETGKDLKATIQIYLDNGVSKSTLATKITSQYKPQLIALKQSGKGYADLQARILTAYEALGYDRNKKLKDIQKWFDTEGKK